MTFNVMIHTKSKSYPITTTDMEPIFKLIREKSDIWINSPSQGFWVQFPHIEGIEYHEQASEAALAPDQSLEEAIDEHARAEALIHQQQTIEG